MSFFQHLGTQAVNAVTTGMTVQSVQKMMNEFGYIQNPAVTVALTLKNRRVGDSIFDYNDYDIGMLPGQTFNKGAYMGFEAIFVKSVIIQPYTDLIITNQNRFLRKTVIHNGTAIPQQHDFTFIKPLAMSIYCVESMADGVFEVRNGSVWLDGRLWSIIGAVTVITIIVICLIAVEVNGSKETYAKPAPHEARIDNISDFNLIRRKINQRFVEDMPEQDV